MSKGMHHSAGAWKWLAVPAVLLLFLAGAATAQTGSRVTAGNWSVYAGYYWPENEEMGDTLTAGFRTAFDVGEYFGLEGTAGYVRDEPGLTSKGQETRTAIIFLDGSLTWDFHGKESRFSVMPLFGIGYARLKTTVGGLSETLSSTTIHAGMALKWRLGEERKHMLRFEVRGRQYEETDSLDWEATAGMSFRFKNR